MDSKNDISVLTVKYLGRTLLAFVIGAFMVALAYLGYNTYFSVSKEKIEVRAVNSNLIR